MKYFVDFHNGMFEELDATTLQEAMEEVDSRIGYTQQSVTIEDEDGDELACRTWYGVGPSEEDLEDDGILQIGAGFYTGWNW